MKLYLVFLYCVVGELAAQQVENELLHSYFQASAYPVDINLGELYSPLQASREAASIQATSKDFWESLFAKHELKSEVIAPYSKELLLRQFDALLEKEKNDEDTFVLRSILAGRTKMISDTARITSKLIFENEISLLVTLYFQNRRTLTRTLRNQEGSDLAVSWLIEAVDFDLNNAEKLVDGYSYDPRANNFLEQAG